MESLGDGAEASVSLRMGDRVVLPGQTDQKGTVRWTGTLRDYQALGVVAGVEFDNPIGTGSGKYKSQRLFYAKLGHASLVPLCGLVREEDFYCSDQGEPSDQTTGHRTSQDKAGSKR
ncbi:hypothetical protein ACOMHN_040534 [Nucella lapillus]